MPLPADASFMAHPKGFKVDHYDIAVHGICADCADKQKK
jgi:Fe2+ or Zn2+ uptake regulation protein